MEQNDVSIGLKKRASAFALDFLVMAAYIAVLASVTLLLLRAKVITMNMAAPVTRDLVAFLTLILPVILYFSLMESSPGQATLGKRKLGLKVAAREGGRLSFGRALLRSGLKFLPWQMAHTTVFQIWAGNTSPFIFALSILAQILVVVYILSIWLGKRHRAPYDWAANSVVTGV